MNGETRRLWVPPRGGCQVLGGRTPHIAVAPYARCAVAHSLSGEGRAWGLMGVLNAYFGIEFEFTALFLEKNFGLKLFKRIRGEEINVIFHEGNVEFAGANALSAFGDSARAAVGLLWDRMSKGGRLSMVCGGGPLAVGNVPPFSSVRELSMKLKLAGLEKRREETGNGVCAFRNGDRLTGLPVLV